MPSPPDLREAILAAWRTNSRITLFLFENLPPALWAATVPGAPRRTIRMIAGHIHNARCMWIKTLGQPHGIPVPASVDRHRVGARQLLPALKRSGNGIARLLQLGCHHGGTIPPSRSYVWRNLPLDVGHVLGYFIAHEGHHRGQIVLAARALGHRLPGEVTAGLWQWSQRAAEAAATGARPRFRTEAEERRFWETHESADYVDWAQAKEAAFPNLKPSTTTISLRLPAGLLGDLKTLANKRDVPYQSLLKLLLSESIERERGDGCRRTVPIMRMHLPKTSRTVSSSSRGSGRRVRR